MQFMATVIQNQMAVRQFIGLTCKKHLTYNWIYMFVICFANVFIRLKFPYESNKI